MRVGAAAAGCASRLLAEFEGPCWPGIQRNGKKEKKEKKRKNKKRKASKQHVFECVCVCARARVWVCGDIRLMTCRS